MQKKLLLFLFFISTSLFAFLVPDGADYKVIELKKLRVIYSVEARPFLQRLIQMENHIIRDYQKSFDWNLDDKLTVVLASDGNQVANAFSTPFLRNVNTFYNGGGALIDYFAMKSWMFSLVSHEGAHAYQLDTKKGFSKFYYSIFGSSPFPHVFIAIPIFTNPNFLLPLWIIEGNAVFNESRFGNGGRLFSGELRALYCSLVKESKLDAKRLTNNHLDFPFTQEKYIVGGYFFNFLYEKYGLERVNSFFKAQSTHWIYPLILSSTFNNHFGASYYNLIDEFLNNYSNFCKKQQKLEIKAFASSIARTPLGSDQEDVWGLVTDGKSTPILYVIDKKQQKIQKRKLDIGLDNIFKIKKNKFVSGGSGKVNKKRIKFSLWDKYGNEVDEKYRGKIIVDKKKNDILWISPNESFDEPYLYHNKKKIGITHSSGKFDNDLNVYRFVQRGNERILYKNQTQVFSIRSFYSKIMDISADGRIYFIAGTMTGSTLFYYYNKDIYKAQNSDVIIDAKKLDTKYLVVETTAEGYEYKIVDLKFTKALPEFYKYKFIASSDFKIYDSISTQKHSLSKIADLEKDYSMIKNIEFKGGRSAISFAGKGVLANASFRVSDPLEFHQVLLDFGTNKFSGSDYVETKYTLLKYLWDWSIFHEYSRKYRTDDNPNRLKDIDQLVGMGVMIPLIETRNSDLNTMFTFALDLQDDEEVGYWMSHYSYLRDYRLSYFPYRKFDALVEYEFKTDGEYTAGLWLKWMMDVKNETIISIDSLVKTSNDFELPMSEIKYSLASPIISVDYSLFSNDDEKQSIRIGGEIKKVINSSLYFSKFPLSLRRFAPQIMGHYFHFKNVFTSSFYQLGAGVNFELLLGHLAPVSVSINYITKEFDENHFVFSFGTVF